MTQAHPPLAPAATELTAAHAQSLRYWKWRVLLATMFCYLFYYCGRFNLAICLGPIMNEFGWDKAMMGVLSSSLIISYGIGQFINGNMADRYGRVLMLIGALVSCAMNWLFSYAPDIGMSLGPVLGIASTSMMIFGVMAVVWSINGYFQAMGMAPGGRLISNWWLHRERGLAMGLYTFAAAMANVTVFVLASYTADAMGWRAAFRYPVLLMAGTAIVFYFVTRDRPDQVGLPCPHESSGVALRVRSAWQRYREALTHGSFVMASLSIALHHIARWGLLTFVPIFFMETRGWRIKDAGLTATALPLGMALGAVTGGYISDRFFGGRRGRVIMLSLVLCAASIVVIPLVNGATPSGDAAAAAALVSPEFAAVAMLIISGYVLYLCIAPYFALPADLLGAGMAGTGIGLMNAAAYGGAAVGTAVAGWLIQRHGYSVGFSFMAACALAGAALMLFVREKDTSQ